MSNCLQVEGLQSKIIKKEKEFHSVKNLNMHGLILKVIVVWKAKKNHHEGHLDKSVQLQFEHPKANS